MSLIIFADNASALLASSISSSDTTIVLSAGTGVAFSAPGAGQIAFGTLEDVSGNIEIVKITSRTIDSVVVVRAQEGTTAQAFASGTRFEQRPTAGIQAAMLQKGGGDTLAGTTNVTGVINLGSGGSIQNGEIAGTAVRSQPGDTSNQIHVGIGTPATAAGSPIMTTANFLSELPAGVGAVISGMVLMWSGTSGSVPAGYVLCDGTNSTPDLRDKFVLGAGGALPTVGGSASTTTGASSIGTLTIDPHVLTIGEIPGHTHVGATVTGSGDDNSQAPMPFLEGSNVQSLGVVSLPDFTTASAGGGGGHTHTGTSTGTHTHSYTLPPYRALFFIMKT